MNGWLYLFWIPSPTWEWYWRIPGFVFVVILTSWAAEAVRYWLKYRREKRLDLIREIMET